VTGLTRSVATHQLIGQAQGILMERHKLNEPTSRPSRCWSSQPVAASRATRGRSARLVSTDWPAALQVTALDADSGELHVFDACCGVSLLDGVAASGAIPGVWPLERFAGRFWIDGGMVSAANAHLASGYGRVVVIAPVPDG